MPETITPTAEKSSFFRRIATQATGSRKQSADFIWNAYRSFDASQWLPAEEIERRQVNALRVLLRHCARNVPYYRRLFTEQRIDPAKIDSLDAVRRLPILSRRTFQAQCDDFRAARLPQGMCLTSQASTSGTTGVPITVLQTNIVRLLWCVFVLRDLEWAGFDPRGSFASIRNLDIHHADQPAGQGTSRAMWGSPFGDVIETGPSSVLPVQADHARQWEWLRDVDPECLLSTAGNLEGLALSAEPFGRPLPRLRVLQSFSESLSDESRGRIEAAFGVPVWNMYTCMEAGYLASPCPSEPGTYHVHAENVLLEVLNEHGQPCAAGEAGRVVLTPLMNFAHPLVRYEIGDEVVLGKACPCGRGLPTLSRIVGKTRPLFLLPGGRRKSTTVLASSLYSIKAISQYQVEQRAADEIVVRIVPASDWSEDLTREVVEKLTAFLESPASVTVEVIDRIPPGPGGKVSSFIAMRGV